MLGPLKRPLRHSWGPQKGPFWPKQPLWGPQRSSGSPEGLDLVPATSGWSNWVGRIHTMRLGPFRDLYGTPRGPQKGPVLAQIAPFGGPRRSSGSPWRLDLVPAATGWSNREGLIHTMRMGPLRDLLGTPGPPKVLILAQKAPFGGPGGPWAAPAGLILVGGELNPRISQNFEKLLSPGIFGCSFMYETQGIYQFLPNVSFLPTYLGSENFKNHYIRVKYQNCRRPMVWSIKTCARRALS